MLPPIRHSHRIEFVESLESRLLFAAHLAPDSVNGLVINMAITDSTGIFSSASGSFELRNSPDANIYAMQGALSSSGTANLHRFSAAGIVINLSDPGGTLGGVPRVAMTFSSATAGTFRFVTEDVYAGGFTGTMDGTFAISGTVRPLVELSNGLLTVTGTVGDDTVSIANSGGQISVTQNNFTSAPFAAADVTRINAQLRDGKDVLTVGSAVPGCYINGGAGNDNLSGGDGNDTITGGAGKNILYGNNGEDRLNGSGGRDLIFGGAGADRLYGNGGDDTMDGGGNVDRLFGGDGNDILKGGSSNDKLYGEAGNDTLFGGDGSDLEDGGPGTDVATSDGTDILVNIP